MFGTDDFATPTVTTSDVTIVTPVPSTEIDVADMIALMSAEIDTLRRRAKASAESVGFSETVNSNLSTTLANARRDHRNDIDIIGARLLSEAEDRQWCSEYDSVVSDLNATLMVELPVRSSNFIVEATITVRVSVEARDADEAREQAADYLNGAERGAYMADGVASAELADTYSWDMESDDE